MSYTEFTLDSVERLLGIIPQPDDLFGSIAPLAVPPWLAEILAKGMQLSLISEKARSEFIVAPILLASRELSHDAVSVYSGQRLDVDPEHGLVGECDFILSGSPPMPVLRTPLVTIVEAKRNDIDAGLGQCTAQMAAARQFNKQANRAVAFVFGCVTTGEDWQFLRLDDGIVCIDRKRYYINNVGQILAVFQAIIGQFATPRGEAPADENGNRFGNQRTIHR